MTKAIVDPKELREFAADLKAFNERLQSEISRLNARFRRLGESWRDQEHAKFAQTYQDTTKVLRRFLQASQDHIPYLKRKAEAAEEYLRRR